MYIHTHPWRTKATYNEDSLNSTTITKKPFSQVFFCFLRGLHPLFSVFLFDFASNTRQSRGIHLELEHQRIVIPVFLFLFSFFSFFFRTAAVQLLTGDKGERAGTFFSSSLFSAEEKQNSRGLLSYEKKREAKPIRLDLWAWRIVDNNKEVSRGTL